MILLFRHVWVFYPLPTWRDPFQSHRHCRASRLPRFAQVFIKRKTRPFFSCFYPVEENRTVSHTRFFQHIQQALCRPLPVCKRVELLRTFNHPPTCSHWCPCEELRHLELAVVIFPHLTDLCDFSDNSTWRQVGCNVGWPISPWLWPVSNSYCCIYSVE